MLVNEKDISAFAVFLLLSFIFLLYNRQGLRRKSQQLDGIKIDKLSR